MPDSVKTMLKVRGTIAAPKGPAEVEIVYEMDGFCPNDKAQEILSANAAFMQGEFDTALPPQNKPSAPSVAQDKVRPCGCMWKDPGTPKGEGWCSNKDIAKMSRLQDDKGNEVQMSGLDAMKICEEEFKKGNINFITGPQSKNPGSQKYFCPTHLPKVLALKSS